MSSIPMVTKTGPRTYSPVENIRGGQLVEARTGGLVGVAAAGTTKCLGVAITDAQPEDSATASSVDAFGNAVVNTAVVPTRIAVAYGGIEVPVKYTAAAEFGDRLVVAASGTVTPAAAGADPRTIVGTCTQPAGVSAGAVGLMRTA